jgi:hypothetical protein
VTTAAVAREIKGKRVFGFEDLGLGITMSSAPLFIYGRLLGIFSEIVFYMKQKTIAIHQGKNYTLLFRLDAKKSSH